MGGGELEEEGAIQSLFLVGERQAGRLSLVGVWPSSLHSSPREEGGGDVRDRCSNNLFQKEKCFAITLSTLLYVCLIARTRATHFVAE